MKEAPRERKPNDAPADSPGDFFFEELMTAQPDATGAYFRERLRQIQRELAGDERLPLTAPKERED